MTIEYMYMRSDVDSVGYLIVEKAKGGWEFVQAIPTNWGLRHPGNVPVVIDYTLIFKRHTTS